MRTHLTLMVLVLMLGGTAFGGVPVQFWQACSMRQVMDDMECCKAALMRVGNDGAETARLCCAQNRSKEETAPANGVRFAPQLQLRVLLHPSVQQAVLPSHLRNRLFDSSHGPPGGSHAVYIRNLALLI